MKMSLGQILPFDIPFLPGILSATQIVSRCEVKECFSLAVTLESIDSTIRQFASNWNDYIQSQQGWFPNKELLAHAVMIFSRLQYDLGRLHCLEENITQFNLTDRQLSAYTVYRQEVHKFEDSIHNSLFAKLSQ
jgi:hypothetical protein